MLHGFITVNDGTTRRDNAPLCPKFGVDFFFDVDKTLNAGAGNYVAEQSLLFILNEQVAVDISVTYSFCKQHACRALSRSRHADENNVIHIKIIHFNLPAVKHGRIQLLFNN